MREYSKRPSVGRRGAGVLDVGRFGLAPDLPGGSHRVEHARHDLGRPRPRCLIGRLGLEEFGMGEDDPELVVQSVKQHPQIGLRPTGPVIARGGRELHAALPAGSCVSSFVSSRAGAASRHRVSAKIRIEPPAVRTYSTLPAEIQL